MFSHKFTYYTLYYIVAASNFLQMYKNLQSSNNNNMYIIEENNIFKEKICYIFNYTKLKTVYLINFKLFYLSSSIIFLENKKNRKEIFIFGSRHVCIN